MQKLCNVPFTFKIKVLLYLFAFRHYNVSFELDFDSWWLYLNTNLL